MAPVSPFDDVKQKVVYIPFSPPDDDDDEQSVSLAPYNPFQERDMPGGLELRMKAYRKAWNQCLERTQAIINKIQIPVVEAIVEDVCSTYSNILPGLPYTELCVISLTAQAVGPSLITEVTRRLDPSREVEDSEDEGEDEDSLFQSPHADAFVTHLHPSECTSVMLAMKALVGGFVQRSPNRKHDSQKRRPATSLAIYDINLLEAWYQAVTDSHRSDSTNLPRLVVVLYEFEQFDSTVVQDMFYICSLHVPRLPLVFILSMSSPPSPPYLRSAYPRSTLSLLRIRNFSLPNEQKVLEELLTQIYFDLDFEPDIVLGPSVLNFVVEHFTQRTQSLDAFITILQLAHMKHFQEPLTIFVHDALLGSLRHDAAAKKLLKPESFAFLDSIVTRVHNPGPVPDVNHATRWLEQDVPSLLNSIDEARQEFKMRARRMRIAFWMMKFVRDFMLRHGYKSAEAGGSVSELMIAAMSGKLGKESRYLGTMVKKLSSVQLTALMGELQERIPIGQFDDGDVVSKISVAAAVTPNDEPAVARRLAEEFGEWLIDYWRDSFVNVNETELWDIWYTGTSPFPSELINPSVRNTILTGLLYPMDYVNSGDGTRAAETPELWQLPDTSILFRRYLNSGKMINVYDWYESFAVVLDDQRRRTRNNAKTSPTKAASPRKRKEKSTSNDGDESGEEGEEGEEEESPEELAEWRMEVQARFIRALHELDYLGFIKHTGRKADHVLRTVFEVED